MPMRHPRHRGLLLFLAALFAADSARAQVDLVASRVFAGRNRENVFSPRAGDIDGDGLLDIVAVSRSTPDDFGENCFGSVLTFLATDPGVFASPLRFQLTLPEKLELADFDLDGRPDAAVWQRATTTGCFDHSIFHVLLSDGAGGIHGGWSTRVVLGDYAHSDFNGDGRVDVAMATSPATIYLGDGTGDLSLVQSLVLGGEINPRYVLATDLDGDSDNDVVVGGSAGSRVFLNSGFGIFSAGPPALFGATSGASGDLDGDGIVDLALIGATGLRVLHGDGLGGFQPGASLAVDANGSVRVVDLDGDGDLDVVRTMAHALAVFRGDGGGGFAPVEYYAAFSGFHEFDLADVHGDGFLDAVLPCGYSVEVLCGDGQGGFLVAPSYPIGPTTGRVRGLATADFDSDGHADVVATNNSSSRLVAFSGRGDGTLSLTGETVIPFANGPRSIATADFDGNSTIDLVVEAVASLHVLAGDGLGGFAVPTPFVVPTANDIPFLTTIALADFDGNGAMDIARCGRNTSAEGVLSLLRGDGLGGFTVSTTTVAATPATTLAAADLDGDSDPDLAFGLRSQVVLLAGDGAGGFAETTRLAVPLRCTAIAPADLNGDGAIDLAVSSDGGGFPDDERLTIFSGDGAGNYAAAPALAVPKSYSIRAADVDDDGVLDLALAYSASRGGVQVLLGDSLGGFTPSPPFGGGDSSSSAVAADFDEDGRVDFAVSGGESGDVLVLINRTAQASICRRGNVNLGGGGITDVLFVNGSRGLGRGRRLVVDRGASFEMNIVKPPAGGSGRFVLYQWSDRSPSRFTARPQPFALGTTCLATPLTPEPGAVPVEIWNNVGREAKVGAPTLPSSPAPSIVLSLPDGLGVAGRFYFQGFIVDRTAANGKASITNGIFVESR